MGLFSKMKKKNIEILSPIEGIVSPLKEAKDEAFASELMGKGVVIDPEIGEVVAPLDGVVTAIFPTLHAIGIEGENGVSILIHIGIDTVQLKGEGYQTHIKQGDTVKRGQLLLEFDISLIEKKGYCTQTPIIVTNSNSFMNITMTEKKGVTKKDILLTIS